jgi:hypothetical protein
MAFSIRAMAWAIAPSLWPSGTEALKRLAAATTFSNSVLKC